MIDISKGRYWSEPWSLVSGCTRCSPGCDHCWALAMEKRFHKPPIVQGKGIQLHPDRFSIPLKRRKPTVYAVWNDLFHEAVPDEFIFKTFEKICECRGRHTFLILTKRPQRMLEWFYLAQAKETGWFSPCGDLDLWGTYMGLTVCNQAEADAKIPVFLQVPGRKFLSIEPMLGAVDLMKKGSAFTTKYLNSIGAVILGGETGPGARPLHPDWVRSVAGQCFAAGVPFFFKSWGAHIPELHDVFGDRRGVPAIAAFDRALHHRMIDGRTHDELPWVTP